jgi:DnaJ-class molecular chaperone
MDALAIRQWLSSLDALSYYELFRLGERASYDDLRAAFHAFAEIFHPDGHVHRDPSELAAIAYIFKRGTEAYRVLSDPQLRTRYDEALARGILRPESLVVELDASAAKAATARSSSRPSDQLKNAGARPFVLRAEELARNGDPKQAKLQLVMAMHMDPKNAALEAFAKDLEGQIQKKIADDKRSWHKG